MIYSAKQVTSKQLIAIVLLLTLTIFQLVRVIVFVNVYGGLEHDGGWLLGVSRSLAERGTFTTMVSTIVDPNVVGGRTVDGKFDIQDAEGRIWFYTANSVGPLVFLVNAAVLKIAGVEFWSLHVGSLLFFAMYLFLAMAVLLLAQGLRAALLFQLYLFLYPHLSIFLGYEALGEMPGMACVLLTYLIFMYAVAQVETTNLEIGRSWLLWFFLSGLAAGLTINTKLLTLLSFGGMFVIWLRLFLKQRTVFKGGLALAAGVLTLPLLWELTHLIVLTFVADFSAYQQNLWGRLDHFLNEGSGVGAKGFSGTQFFWDKALVVSEISAPDQLLGLLTLLLIAVGGGTLIWLYRSNQRQQNWLVLLWVGWLGNALWFIGLSKTGWVRHAWFGLILAVMLLCLIIGEVIYRLRRPNWRNVVVAVIVAAIILPGFWAQRSAISLFISDDLVELWRQKQVTARYSRVPWMITPRSEQERVVDFLLQLPGEGRVFYPANHKAAEIAVQTGKILYPIARRELMPPAEGDVILIGATLISPWKDPGLRHSLIERAKAECPNFLYESEYYIVCTQW